MSSSNISSNASHAGTLTPISEELDIRDEYRLLLLCARTRVEAEQREQIRVLVLKQLDWEFILGKAQPHALIPLLYRNLSTYCADLVPSSVIQQLESDNKAICERSRKNTEETVKVLHDLKAANITAVPYKGSALAVQAHGAVELRKFWDLDIVILPRDIPAAKSLLLSLGYEWHPMMGQVTGPNEAHNFRVWHEYDFVHPDTRMIIDLHWRITPNRFPFKVDLDRIFKHLIPVRLLDEDVLTFPPEVLLLFLCVHGGKDMWWKRIGWICDIAELLTSNTDLDWSYIFDLAEETSSQRMLLLGLAIAHKLLQAPLPEHVLIRIRADRSVQALVEYVQRRLFDNEAAIDFFVERQRFHIMVRERFRDKIPAYQHMIKAAFTKIFVPDSKTRELVKLPSVLSPLYYLLHPARLAYKVLTHNNRRSEATH